MAEPYMVLGAQQIRLLTFLEDSGLNCLLSTHSLLEAPEYACLSYTWHDKSLPERSSTKDSILLGGQRSTIGRNLCTALEHLGPAVHRRGIKLWVDAICINQDDFTERANQVRLMKDIYERASEVMAWIGLPNSDEEMRLAMEMMRNMSALPSEFRNIRYAQAHTIFDEDNDNEKLHAAWACMVQMLKRPYWSRTWVHQEATVSTARFYCGKWSFGWSELFAFNDFHQTYGGLRDIDVRFKLVFAGEQNVGSPLLDLVVARVNRALAMETSRADLSQLAILVRQLRLTSCSDARDKIFAAIPHASDASAALAGGLLTTDYNKAASEVYTDLARYCIHHGRGLEILGFVCGPASGENHCSRLTVGGEKIPSWVPDWRHPSRIRPVNSGGLLHGAYPVMYNPLPDSAAARIEATESELHISAIIFDKIRFVTSALGRDINEDGMETTWKLSLKEACPTFIDQAFNRTLVGNIQHVEDNDTQLATNFRGGAFDWDLHHTSSELRKAGVQVKRRNQFHALRGMTRDRRAGCTERGLLGMFGEGTVVGDCVAAFHGGNALYVLRPTDHDDDRYELVGECYVDDMMDGQVLDVAAENDLVSKKIVLI